MNNTAPRFIHLHVHSDYSMIDGVAKVPSLIEKSVSLDMPALALTDFTNLFGLVKFYKLAHKFGIKPIIGADFLMQNKIFPQELVSLTILASNEIGYDNLRLLISQTYQRGYMSSGPIIDQDWLIQYNQGLIILSGFKGDIGKCLIYRHNNFQLEQCLIFYKRYFADRYYLELTRTGRENEEHYVQAAVEFAMRQSLPVVATNDIRFIDKKDFDTHEVRVAIHNGYILNDIKRPHTYSPQQYMRSEKEMCNLFSDIPEALENSIEIARRCNLTLNLGQYFLPNFPTKGISTKDFLIKRANEGLEKRLKFKFINVKDRDKRFVSYKNRLTHELKIINQMGFPGYFLIVMEFIQWAKDHHIPVGPGRGSGAGSLVAYALKITDIDPLDFDLLFERFLNSERISMPDFDIDFCMEKRDLVIDHVANIYGRHAVAQIITFGTLSAKVVIRDVGRVLDYPYSFVDRIAKLVRPDPGMTLEKAFIIEPQLSKLYHSDEDIGMLLDMSRKLEGIIRNVGKHAGGVVIAPTRITDFSPIYCDETGKNPVTQFDKNDIEDIGLIKFDFLGLRTLTIIKRAMDMINTTLKQNKIPPIDISSIPLYNEKSFEYLRKAETTAVFQLESKGMRDLIKRLKPDCFEDIIALIALFRPGPLQSGMVENFINRKHGKEKISYPDIRWQHESLKPILESTYGIILYQEQVMQIAQVLAGYTLSKADLLRCAMGKKKPDEMAKQRNFFKEGAQKKGIDSNLAMKIFDMMEHFADYGFNKSHSTAYALLSYQTLWLKTHYPYEFMASVMSADMDHIDKIRSLIEECNRMGMTVLPPNINTSQFHFHVNKKGQIVYGLGAIKGIGEASIQEIIKGRNQSGMFIDMFDLCVRAQMKNLNRRILEKFILSGSFDCFKQHRAELMQSIDTILKSANQYIQSQLLGQIDMFSDSIPNREYAVSHSSSIQRQQDILPWSEQIKLRGEHETLGLYLTGHPVDQYQNEIQYYSSGIRLKDIQKNHTIGSIITVVGLIISVRLVLTKRENQMAILTLEDRSGRLEVVLFRDILEKYRHLLENDDRILIVKGYVASEDSRGYMKMIASQLMDIKEARKKMEYYSSYQ
ncbi:DNA polymerase III subunit alpha [Candidatus Schneideria nysicola]|nr:DNA polymerase III subunit alpha [Candidatus Schneideria nysicola]